MRSFAPATDRKVALKHPPKESPLAHRTTAEQNRDWAGPAILSYGFRPFFLGGALWAAIAMALWIAMLSDWMTLPTAFDPVSWHAHEFLFGYLPAIATGFLLTAIPNWTKRLPVICKGYAPRDIFNADKTGFFYPTLPQRSLAQRGANAKNGKLAKERITVLLASSAT